MHSTGPGQARAANTCSARTATKVNVTVTPGGFALDRLSKDLIGFGQACWRTHSSELDDKGFFNHTPRPYNPVYKA